MKSKHLNYLIKNQERLIFLSKKKINRQNINLVNYLEFKIAALRNFQINKLKNIFLKKEIFLGDTDIFMTLN